MEQTETGTTRDNFIKLLMLDQETFKYRRNSRTVAMDVLGGGRSDQGSSGNGNITKKDTLPDP